MTDDAPDLLLAIYRELATAELEETAVALTYDLTADIPDMQRAMTRARLTAIQTVLAERREGRST